MIELTKIDGTPVTVNAEEIEILESGHDTTITLCSGRKFQVSESRYEIASKVIQYKKEIHNYSKLHSSGEGK